LNGTLDIATEKLSHEWIIRFIDFVNGAIPLNAAPVQEYHSICGPAYGAVLVSDDDVGTTPSASLNIPNQIFDDS
jgi:hypothetical protein